MTSQAINFLDVAHPFSAGGDALVKPEHLVRVSGNVVEIDFWMASELEVSICAAFLGIKECIKRTEIDNDTMESFAAAMMVVAASVITMKAMDDNVLSSVICQSLVENLDVKDAANWKDVVMNVFLAAGRMRDNVKINLQDMSVSVEPIVDDEGSSDRDMSEEEIMELIFPSNLE